jgi:NADPH:quinone reductase
MSLVGVAFGMSAIKDPAMNRANFRQLFDWFDEGSLRPTAGDVLSFGDLPPGLCRAPRLTHHR